MKIFKYVLGLCLISMFFIGCEDDENLDFIDSAVAPSELSLLTEITQDNTGLVTLSPRASAVTNYTLDLGDSSEVITNIQPGEKVEHTYTEGVYTATLTAIGLGGKTTMLSQEVIVSFNAPQNLVVTIENDPAISKQVNLTATADFAMSYQIDFGDASDLVTANIGDTVNYIFENEGIYTINVVAMGGAIETTSYTEEFEVTAIVQPIASASAPPARADEDIISIFSSVYNDVPGTNYFPDWGQGSNGSSWAMFNLNGDDMLQYINLSYQGIALADGTSVDVSSMEFIHLDVWTADVVTDIEVSLINSPSNTQEAPATRSLNADSWTSIEIPISEYTDQGLSVNEIFQLKFVGTPSGAGTVFIDNIYFYKEPSTAPSILGTWKIAPEAGSLKVGPSPGSGEWFSISDAQVAERACYFDDVYAFNANGTFQNILGTETWIENWQSGNGDACGAPVAPHDGNTASTFSYNEGTGSLTLDGTGAYIGIPKAYNSGEISTPGDAPTSVTYNVVFEDINTMTVQVEAGSGVFWTYKLIRDGDAPQSPLAGSWSVAPEAGSLKVGPSSGSGEWFSISDAQVAERACFFDDTYVFGNDGSFANVLGADTWVENWQTGNGDACGVPVAPHDGLTASTFVYDETTGELTLDGTGAYLGIPKAYNAGEISSPGDAPASVTYQVSVIDDNTISVEIEAGTGVFWTYKLIKN